MGSGGLNRIPGKKGYVTFCASSKSKHHLGPGSLWQKPSLTTPLYSHSQKLTVSLAIAN